MSKLLIESIEGKNHVDASKELKSILAEKVVLKLESLKYKVAENFAEEKDCCDDEEDVEEETNSDLKDEDEVVDFEKEED